MLLFPLLWYWSLKGHQRVNKTEVELKQSSHNTPAFFQNTRTNIWSFINQIPAFVHRANFILMALTSIRWTVLLAYITCYTFPDHLLNVGNRMVLCSYDPPDSHAQKYPHNLTLKCGIFCP